MCSMRVRTRHLHQYGASEFRHNQPGHGGSIRDVRGRSVPGPDINHRRHPYDPLASICLWYCVLTQGYHEQRVWPPDI